MKLKVYHCLRRRRAQHPDLAHHRLGGRGVRDPHLQRRRRGAGGAHRRAGRPGHPGHQDAPHGRHGAAAPPAPADRHAGDLPHLQGPRRSTNCSASTWARTITSPSRSRSAWWWSASRRCCDDTSPRTLPELPPRRRALLSAAGYARSAPSTAARRFPFVRSAGSTLRSDYHHLLEKQGVSLWWDEQLDPGDRFRLTISKKIKDCLSLITLVTANSIESRWVEEEYAYAEQVGTPIIPVRLFASEMPLGLIRSHVYEITKWPEDEEGAMRMAEELAAKVKTVKKSLLTPNHLCSPDTSVGPGPTHLPLGQRTP